MPTVKHRNWKEINRKLIKRGEFLINPRFLSTWIDEIRQMNAGKVGQPYLYPKSLIEFLAYLHCHGIPYRQCQGILEGLSNNYAYRFPVISYTQICRRMNCLEIDFRSTEQNLIVAIDGSGEKVSNRGEWIRHKWKVRRGWIKVVIMGTPDGKVVDVRVGNENLDERKAGRGMIRANHKRLTKVIADGAHDCRELSIFVSDMESKLQLRYGKMLLRALVVRRGAGKKFGSTSISAMNDGQKRKVMV